MDSEVLKDGRILDLIDDAWREDKLPYEDVAIPLVGELLLSITVKGDVPLPRNSTKSIAGGTAYLCKRFPGWIRLTLVLHASHSCGHMRMWIFLSPLPCGEKCWISSQLECSSHGTILGLAPGRSRTLFSLCFPFLLLVFEVVSQLVGRTEEQSHAEHLGYSLSSEIPFKKLKFSQIPS